MVLRPRRADGERVGSFEIVRYLASGGMGDVYAGRDTRTGEAVALKFLGDTTAAGLERFEREGRIASSLRHPNIVGGRGYGRADDGVAFIAMEFLEGADLDTLLHREGVPAARVVALARQVCDALEAAHAKRIVHRDLKPQNIFVCGEDHASIAKVLDFGIARLADDRRVTGTGMIVGTWVYMSPEQARGEPDIDARSDLWSLGVVLYECLSGVVPFEAPTSAGTLYKIMFEHPMDLAERCPTLPPSLTDVVRRALSKSRDVRFPTAGAMGLALAAVDTERLAATQRAMQRALSVGDTLAASATGLDATQASSSSDAGATLENRITTVVLLRGVREASLVQDLAHELQGRVIPLAGEIVLVVFGSDRWTGDEPHRAVRLALVAAGTARCIGIATGRAVPGAREVVGAAVDAAVSLAHGESVTLDAATTSAVRSAFPLTIHPDGTSTLDPRVQPRRVAPVEGSYVTPFVGRDLELAMLTQCAESAVDDAQPRGVAVLGAVGMGKSRLRHEALLALQHAHPDAFVLMARCEAHRRDTPFASLVEALADVVDASVTRAFMAVAQGAGDPVASLDRARTTLETLLRGFAQRGVVVLAIDDVQWLDPSSQAALRGVCETAPDLPLAIWMFGRPEGRAVMASVLPEASVVELKPLARAAAEALLKAVAGTASESVLERASGHPLFLEELGRMEFTRAQTGTIVAALPPSIEGAHLSQLDQLDLADREFVKRAAVFGRTAWVEAVVALGADATGFDRLRKANVVLPRPRSRFEGAREFAFRSGVMHEVAYGLWTDGQRGRLHERAAQWLSTCDGVAPDELARHWDEGGDRARAAEAYTAAAEATALVSDTATTCAHAARALALTDNAAVRWRALVARDNALQLADDRALQGDGIREITRLAETMGAREQAEAAWRECYFARVTMDRERTLRAGHRAIELGGDLALTRWAAVAHIELATQLASDGAADDAETHAVLARTLADREKDPWLEARASSTWAYVLVERGRYDEALEIYDVAARQFARAGDRRREALSLANLGSMLFTMGRLAEAERCAVDSIEKSRRVGNVRTVAVATHNLGVIERVQGRLDAAREHQAFAAGQAMRLNHVRLAVVAATEQVYLAIGDGGPDPKWHTRAEHAWSLAQGRSVQEQAETLAAVLRLQRCANAVDPNAIATARALCARLTHEHELRADLLAALYEVDGRTDVDRCGAREAIVSWLARWPDAEERAACLHVFCVRRRIPGEIGDDARTA